MKTKKQRARQYRNRMKKMRDRLDIKNVYDEDGNLIRSSFLETCRLNKERQTPSRKIKFPADVVIITKGKRVQFVKHGARKPTVTKLHK